MPCPSQVYHDNVTAQNEMRLSPSTKGRTSLPSYPTQRAAPLVPKTSTAASSSNIVDSTAQQKKRENDTRNHDLATIKKQLKIMSQIGYVNSKKMKTVYETTV